MKNFLHFNKYFTENYIYNLKSSSLLQAVFVCLLISLLCGALIMISSSYKLLNDKLTLRQELISQNNSALHYLEMNPEFWNGKSFSLYNGINNKASQWSWGLLDVSTVSTFFGSDTIEKTYLSTFNEIKNKQALYLADRGEILRIGGETKLFGDITIPKGYFEKSNLNGMLNNVKVSGEIKKSLSTLPMLDINLKNIQNKNLALIDQLDSYSKMNINYFDDPSKRIYLNENSDISNMTFKGNILIYSNSKIFIPKTTTLEDVIIKAPSVEFESGFIGNVQVIAEKNVIVNENVSLKYPSIIYATQDTDSLTVNLGEKSSLIGAIIIDGLTYDGSLNRNLSLSKNSLVVGDIYCYGYLNLKGTIYGRVYTDKLKHNEQSFIDSNTLLNAIINVDSLPEKFSSLLPLKNDTNIKEIEIIKNL